MEKPKMTEEKTLEAHEYWWEEEFIQYFAFFMRQAGHPPHWVANECEQLFTFLTNWKKTVEEEPIEAENNENES